jgi:NAD(P)-dependent dehydrogenase (short-subunit alcohol dehydrogenase family)
MAHALGEAGARIMLSSRKADDLEEAVPTCRPPASTPAGLPPTAPRKRTSAAWPMRRCSAWAMWTSWSTTRAPPGARPAEDHPVEAWDKVMNLNIRGYFILSQHIAKHSMIGRKRPHHQHRQPSPAWAATRGHADDCLQHLQGRGDQFHPGAGGRMGHYNITVNAICPGFFPSKMTVGTLKAMGEDKLAAHAPLGRLGDDEDLKGLTLLYASDAGKHITGQWLAVDGGVSIVTGG